MFYYIMFCVVLFTFLGITWKQSDWVNLSFKLVFLTLAVVGLLLSWNNLLAVFK